MIPPEQRDAIQQGLRDQLRRKRPAIDTREINELSRAIADAYLDQQPVTFVLFDKTRDQEITGIINQIDQQTRRLKIVAIEEWIWVPFEDVLSVRKAGCS